MNDRLWTIDDIASYLVVGKSTAYCTAATPSFPRAVRIGKGVRRWIPNEIEAWVKRQRDE